MSDSSYRSVTILRPVPPSCLKWKAGPWVGMAALQQSLRAQQPAWLEIEKKAWATKPRFAADSIPWLWCWYEQGFLREHAKTGHPFIIGPNLYPDRAIGQGDCRLSIVHCPHHQSWIERGSKVSLADRTLLCPYPIYPQPEGPLEAEYDVLFYRKKAPAPGIVEALRARWRVAYIEYGKHTRPQLFDLARRSRCCVYWSKHDTGSLVQAETLLAGCPTVGSRGGSPWLVPGDTGVVIENWSAEATAVAVEQALAIDRELVRNWALKQFSSERIAALVSSRLAQLIAQ